jgi:hypothetical protein
MFVSLLLLARIVYRFIAVIRPGMWQFQADANHRCHQKSPRYARDSGVAVAPTRHYLASRQCRPPATPARTNRASNGAHSR